MKRGTRQLGIRERGGPIQTAFSRQNHHCNLLGTNGIRPNPANTESKNKTAFVPPAIPSLAPVRIIRVYPCPSVVQTLDERKITKRTDFLLFALSAAFRIAFWLFDG
jgi:hypothetical protein